ncbi:MAG: choice-of-anchor V domain-containing protein [Chitinophagales bacterium]|nr:T9SS type A sorting domain-containing protein [Chitinophagales bacterium]MDW8272789.1 choice-of-anchor V domain-containing protein [Chitinophagales bacterium]
MKKFYAFVSVILLALLITLNHKTFTNSTTPPPGYSGDPVNNKTCASGGGCHGSNTLDGTSVITLQIGTSQGLLTPMNGNYTLTPSTDYFIGVSINGVAQKYGFSVSALTAGNQQAGTFTITNTNNTQKNQLNNIEYVTHKNSTQTKNWIFKWKSPANVSGPITFYATANLADGNGNAGSDNIYKRTAIINSNPSSIDDVAVFTDAVIYPNPAYGHISFSYHLLSPSFVIAQIMNQEGRIVKKLFGENQSTGLVEKKFDVTELPSGKYFLHLSAAGRSSVKPFAKF